jgi:GNAT superfamily N-acetyltransferase
MEIVAMILEWIHENPSHWDAQKVSVFAGIPGGIFDLGDREVGDLMPGDWWRVEEQGAVLGYGWMDCTWGDAEILLAIAPGHSGKGVGTFVLDSLEKEAAKQGLNYLYNVVRPGHPDREGVTRWLCSRRFLDSGDGLLKRQVGHGGQR